MTKQEIIDSHPAFRKDCQCDTKSQDVSVTLTNGDTYTDAMCSVCIEQSNALGVKVHAIAR